MITIIDYGLGNLRSVQKAFERINHQCEITSDYAQIEKADKLVLPGVGHFKKGMENLKELDIFNILNRKVIQEKTLILGICLGMQLMTNYSEEGNKEGFGWINASTKKLNGVINNKLKIPHIGWNSLNNIQNESILKNINENDLFYFVHSFYVKCENEEDVISTTNYDLEFHSSFKKNNIFGVQFHPEKSHKAGLQIIKNFATL